MYRTQNVERTRHKTEKDRIQNSANLIQVKVKGKPVLT